MTNSDSSADDPPVRQRVIVGRPPLWERHPALTGGLLTIMGAVVAGVIGFSAAQVGAQASLDVARMQNDAENNRRAQDRRDIVYRDYLEAANTFFYAWASIRNSEQAKPIEGAKVERFQTARFDYQGHLNEVFVHGSDDGWKAAKRVNSTLPPSNANAPLLPPLDTHDDPGAFRKAFNDLLDIRCAEAAPVLRNGCSGL